MWTQAAAALGHDADAGAVDYRTLPDLDLYAVRDRWTREQAWAPGYVAAEMRTAYELGREYAEDAALAGARLATLEPNDPEWERTAEQAARSRRLADLNLERARQLEEIHHARGGWYETTEEARIADEAARDELVRRGLPPQRVLDTGEQLELFDPADVTEPTVEVDTAAVELDTAREVVDEPQLYFDDVHADRAADLDAGTAARDAEREPAAAEWAAELVDEPFAELDDVELEEQPTAAEDAQRAPDRADDVEREPEPAAEVSEVEQLTLLDVEPSIVDQVGAQPLRTPEPAAEPAVEDSMDVELERAQTTLAEARRAAEAAEQQRVTRDAIAEARAAVQALLAAEAERERRDEAERREHGLPGVDRPAVDLRVPAAWAWRCRPSPCVAANAVGASATDAATAARRGGGGEARDGHWGPVRRFPLSTGYQVR